MGKIVEKVEEVLLGMMKGKEKVYMKEFIEETGLNPWGISEILRKLAKENKIKVSNERATKIYSLL